MHTRLFHTLVVCGTALGAVPLACAADPDGHAGARPGTEAAGGQAESSEPERAARCLAPDGGCNEHCAPLASGDCLDPCFVHTEECSPDCRLPDGGCGWPPTK